MVDWDGWRRLSIFLPLPDRSQDKKPDGLQIDNGKIDSRAAG
jgi:hypothetical protein